MSGPFSLRYIHLFVPKLSSGAFILSKNGKSADVVGMSKHDVAKALGAYGLQSGYQYFWFAYAKSSHEAQELALAWHHRYLPPDSPLPSDSLSKSDWQCEVSGCTACALAQMRNSLSS